MEHQENSKVYGYQRVSSRQQNLERQQEALLSYGVLERDIYSDKVSGKDFNRNEYILLKEKLLRSGDTLVVKELDRLGRNYEMLKLEWKELHDKGIEVVVLDMPILSTKDKSDLEKKLTSNLVFELLAYLAEKERLKNRERQAEGILIAKASGKYKGRKRIERINFDEVYKQCHSGEITATEAMRQLNMKPNTFYRRVREWKEKTNVVNFEG